MKTAILRVIWKLTYACQFKKIIGSEFGFFECYGFGGGSLENLHYDLSVDPCDCAKDDAVYWFEL